MNDDVILRIAILFGFTVFYLACGHLADRVFSKRDQRNMQKTLDEAEEARFRRQEEAPTPWEIKCIVEEKEENKRKAKKRKARKRKLKKAGGH